jgi:hypothetical protein
MLHKHDSCTKTRTATERKTLESTQLYTESNQEEKTKAKEWKMLESTQVYTEGNQEKRQGQKSTRVKSWRPPKKLKKGEKRNRSPFMYVMYVCGIGF